MNVSGHRTESAVKMIFPKNSIGSGFSALAALLALLCFPLAAPALDSRFHADAAKPSEVRRSEIIAAGSLVDHQGEILLLPDADYYETLLHRIRQAKHRIDLSMFIFKITDSPRNRPAVILQELIAASKRGVTVNMLLERSDGYQDLNRENQRVAEMMRRQGIKVFFASPRRTNHTKLVVIDDRYSFVGSHNFTHAALARNSELSLLIDNHRLAAELKKYIAAISD